MITHQRHQIEPKMDCELCQFENPKCSVTAVIIKNNKLLTLRRAKEPFLGALDLPGGYMQKNEAPERALQRELKEELNVNSQLTFIGKFLGTGYWKSKEFPILSLVYLTEIEEEINLNEENSEYMWLPLSQIDESFIAFNSNQNIVKYLKEKFAFDLSAVKNLIRQLDNTMEFEEYYLYKAVINGYLHCIYHNKMLIGMGWIFPRQTILRKQAVIEDMIIHENYRGQGYGKELLNVLISWAKKNNIDVIELTSNPKRIAANELYKKAGFQLHLTNHYLYKVT